MVRSGAVRTTNPNAWRTWVASIVHFCRLRTWPIFAFSAATSLLARLASSCDELLPVVSSMYGYIFNASIVLHF